MSKKVLVLKNLDSPVAIGDHYRLVCLTGPSKGQSFVLNTNRLIIGRGERADVRLTDLKASREHAEIAKIGDSWVATDLGSQNGILINDKKVTQSNLRPGDKIIVGQTVFKFMHVSPGEKIDIKENLSEDPLPAKKKNSLPIIIMVAVLVYVIFDSTDDSTKSKKVAKTAPSSGYQDVSSDYLKELKKRQHKEDKVVKEKLNAIYQRGLREFREGNYFRAIGEFNLALIIAPGDPYAEYHLRKTKEKLDKTIEEFSIRAQRDEGALKYKSAIVAYCSIIRLLYTVPEDPRYKNAEKQITALEGRLGMEEGETSCLKKPQAN
jgi:pSer/pThr/pTyr-binding forkhead associated (FHA) protein